MTILKRGREILVRMRERVEAAGKDGSGQALVEYALLVAAVATLVVSLTLLFGPSLATALERVGEHLSDAVERLAGDGDNGNNGGNGNNGAPAPGNSPGSGNNPGIGNNPGNGNSPGSGSNPGKGRGQ